MKIQRVTVEEFRTFVGGRIFGATFVKANGEIRAINARLGVGKYVKGTLPEITAKRNATLKERNKIGCFEVPLRQYRTLNLETLIELRANGEILKAA